MTKQIPISVLNECFDLDSETGLLTWRWRAGILDRINRRHAGKLTAMTANNNGYRRVKIDGLRLFAHRVVYAMHTGEWPNGEIDHIDGNTENNSPSNLRDCTSIVNARNKIMSPQNTSGITGVGFHKASGKYRASINDNHKHVHLGLFLSIPEAVAARDKAANELQYTKRHGK